MLFYCSFRLFIHFISFHFTSRAYKEANECDFKLLSEHRRELLLHIFVALIRFASPSLLKHLHGDDEMLSASQIESAVDSKDFIIIFQCCRGIVRGIHSEFFLGEREISVFIH